MVVTYPALLGYIYLVQIYLVGPDGREEFKTNDCVVIIHLLRCRWSVSANWPKPKQ